MKFDLLFCLRCVAQPPAAYRFPLGITGTYIHALTTSATAAITGGNLQLFIVHLCVCVCMCGGGGGSEAERMNFAA